MGKFPALEELSNFKDIRLPSFPAVGLKILELIKKDEFTVKELAKTISADQALAARTLKLANSALYSPLSRVDTIERAVSVLGTNTLKNIALSFAILDKLKEYEGGDFDYDSFWKHSVTAAVAAETLAIRLPSKMDDAFVTSMLMDIGTLIIYLCRPGEYGRVLSGMKETGKDQVSVEDSVFGFNHMTVSKEILQSWSIPENLYIPIAHHHNSGATPKKYTDEVRLLALSDLVSSLCLEGDGADQSVFDTIREMLVGSYSFTDDEVCHYLDDVAKKSIEVLESFHIPSDGIRPYSDILHGASVELSKLNTGYAKLVMDLKDANERGERLSDQLKEANKALKEMAFKDSLTGLYNHRFLHEMLDKEMKRSERDGRSFALMIFDVDNFKQINDTHGHNQGDAVLMGVSRIISKTIRGGDVGARFGGDEFAVILPNINIGGAEALAERIRYKVEALNTSFKAKMNTNVGFTVSIGVGVYNVSKGKKSKNDIIIAIDQALYKSKAAGRNKVTVAA